MIIEERVKYNEQHINRMRSFAECHGVRCDLQNPQTIQEKLMWLNIYDANPWKSVCADKVLVKDYAKDILGEDIGVPTLKVWDKVDDVNFSVLPERFVIKCNHGSGMNAIVRDKSATNEQDVKNKLRQWMNVDFAFQNGFESHYHWINRKVFAEQMIGEGRGELIDYKFWCFNGKPQFYTINDGNGHGQWMKFYDMDQNLLNYKRRDFMFEPNFDIKQPKTFQMMKEYANKLSSEFKFIRIDFYEYNDKVYLGEFTFTPGAFIFKFENSEDDVKIGNMLKL